MKKVAPVIIAIIFMTCGIATASETVSSRTYESLDKLIGTPDEGGGIGLGPNKTWRLHPSFEYKTSYDSNINREPSEGRDQDIIFGFMPSVQVVRRGSKVAMSSDYTMNYEKYVRFNQQSGFSHTTNHRIEYAGEKINAAVGEKFGVVKSYASSEQSERHTIVYNDVYPEVIYRLTPKFSASAIYENHLMQYKDTSLKEFSHDMNEYGGRIYYHATSKLDVFTEGTGTVTNYYDSGNQDSTGYTVSAGVLGDLTEKSKVSLKTGFRGRNYDAETLNSYNNWILEGVWRYSLTSKTSMDLTLLRDSEESVYQNTAWYGVNKAGLGVQYQMSYALSAEIKSSIQNNHYPRETTEGTVTKKRNDVLTTAEAKLNWKPLHYLKVGLGYVFRYRSSIFSLFDYSEHVIEASTALSF